VAPVTDERGRSEEPVVIETANQKEATMSTRSQALRAPGRAAGTERSQWRFVVAGFVALLLVLAALVGVATLNAPSSPKGGAGHGSRNVTSGDTGAVRVGGNGPYRYHLLP
jgi:hypothetical protein